VIIALNKQVVDRNTPLCAPSTIFGLDYLPLRLKKRDLSLEAEMKFYFSSRSRGSNEWQPVTCRSAIARLRAKSYHTSRATTLNHSLALEYKILAFILLPLSVTEERLDNRAHHTAINPQAAPW